MEVTERPIIEFEMLDYGSFIDKFSAELGALGVPKESCDAILHSVWLFSNLNWAKGYERAKWGSDED